MEDWLISRGERHEILRYIHKVHKKLKRENLTKTSSKCYQKNEKKMHIYSLEIPTEIGMQLKLLTKVGKANNKIEVIRRLVQTRK